MYIVYIYIYSMHLVYTYIYIYSIYRPAWTPPNPLRGGTGGLRTGSYMLHCIANFQGSNIITAYYLLHTSQCAASFSSGHRMVQLCQTPAMSFPAGFSPSLTEYALLVHSSQHLNSCSSVSLSSQPARCAQLVLQ